MLQLLLTLIAALRRKPADPAAEDAQALARHLHLDV